MSTFMKALVADDGPHVGFTMIGSVMAAVRTAMIGNLRTRACGDQFSRSRLSPKLNALFRERAEAGGRSSRGRVSSRAGARAACSPPGLRRARRPRGHDIISGIPYGGPESQRHIDGVRGTPGRRFCAWSATWRGSGDSIRAGAALAAAAELRWAPIRARSF